MTDTAAEQARPDIGEVLNDVKQSIAELRGHAVTADGRRREHIERRVLIYEEIYRILTEHANA